MKDISMNQMINKYNQSINGIYKYDKNYKKKTMNKNDYKQKIIKQKTKQIKINTNKSK